MFPLALIAGWLQGHWWGFISRNYVVWPTFLLMNVFIALKGSHFWFFYTLQNTFLNKKVAFFSKGQRSLTWVLCAMGSLPTNLMQPFPNPSDATHKIRSRLANWLQRYSSSKMWNFRHSRASNSKMSGLIRPKIKLDRAFMPVLVTSNFEDDLIKNERASMETPFSHYKSMGNF